MLTFQQKAVQVAIGQVKGFVYPSPAERAAAYELLIELSTRNTATNVGADASLRDALSSLHAMFDITREILRQHGAETSKGSGGNLSLAVIAVRVLNDVFRPVLSKWHPLLTSYEDKRSPEVTSVEWEQRWALGESCRSELSAMRASVIAYMDTLGRIAGAGILADSLASPPPSALFRQEKLSSAPAHPDGLKHRDEMVRWLRLKEMWRSLPALFPAARDWTRLTEDAKPTAVQPAAVFEAKANEEFWFDYVSDLGDAFDGTAPIAWLMGRTSIELPNDPTNVLPSPPSSLRRGALLVLGGDEVYPFAADGVYESQLALPFEMGFEGPEEGVGRTVVAIPGNHDWLGGISHFRKMFAERTPRESTDSTPPEFAGHWHTAQTRTYWHVKLPQGWWLWGIDTGLKNSLPDVEREYFKQAAKELLPGDRVILCTPVPLWQLRQKHPKDYLAIRSAIDPLIVERKATMPLCLSGDSHFFAHFETADPNIEEDHITAGGGGAFLHPTHGIPERIPLETGNVEFRLTNRWPLPADSRALAPRTSNLRDRQFWLIVVLVGLLHAAFTWLAGLSAGRLPWSSDGVSDGRNFTQRWGDALRWTIASPWALVLLAVLAVAGIGAVAANTRERRLVAAARVYGVFVGAALGGSLVAFTTAFRVIDRDPQWSGRVVAAGIGGALSTMLLFSLLTWVNGQIKAVDNLVFSTAHLTRFKHFIRFRIDLQGDLTCYVVGIDPVGKGWYEAMTKTLVVPPYDPAGIPRIHYVWGKTFPKFVPGPARIALSISDPTRLPKDHTEEQHAQHNVVNHPANEMFGRLCRSFLEGGHSLLYGGIPRYGFTKQLANVAAQRHQNPNVSTHIFGYLSEAYWRPEYGDGSVYDDTNKHIRFMRVKCAARPGETPELLAIRNLTEMRERQTRDLDIRIAFGGDRQPGEGAKTRLAPGILEEAYITLRMGKPLLVIGGFGGVGQLIAEALLGRLDPADVTEWAAHFIEPPPLADGSPGLDSTAMLARFSSPAVLRNGLTDRENRVLLETTDYATAEALIRAAVRRIAENRRS